MFDINKATPEQKQVLLERDKNILVSAAAGSGKTTVMIERIVRTIVNDKVPIENFLIITFTKASAEDMKSKLINRLSCETATPFILSQIDNVPVSDVSNLHSFCARLLKSYFYVVGLDPTFVVIDDIEQNKLKTKALDKLFEIEAKNASKDFYDLVDILSTNRKDGKLREQIIKMYEFSKSMYNFNDWFKNSMNTSFDTNLDKNNCAKIIKNYAKNIIFLFTSEINSLKNEINEICSIDEDKKKLIVYLDSMDTMIKSIDTDNSFEKFMLSIKNLEGFKRLPKVEEENLFLLEKCQNLKKDLQSRIKTIDEAVFSSDDETIESIQEALRKTRHHIMVLYDLFVKFESIYLDLKKDLGVLDFNDLEGFALKVLEDSETLEAIKKKYKYIFVDEYQDINSCQERIISLISSSNNRFMVGDIKQSIYGFRLCDPEIFLDKYNAYKNGEKDSVGISLNKNFRSNAEILEFVNLVFDSTMTKSFGGVNYKEEARLVPGRGPLEKGLAPRACILYMNTTSLEDKNQEIQGELPIYSVKNHDYVETEDMKKAYLEGLMISSKIAELISSNYMIEDKETHKLRHIEYKDIVLLVQSRNDYLNNLLDVLDSFSIPISSDITSDVFDDEDILSLKNLLLIISNFNQDKPLFSVMYSGLFSFSPDELVCIRSNTSEKYFYQAVKNYPNDGSDLYYKILSFKQSIETYKKLASFMIVKDLCYKIISDFNIENYCLSSVNYSERITKLHKFIASLPESSLEEFLSSCELTNIPCESKTAMDSVRVMTIHKSKGLEFPVVFLVGTGNRFNPKSVVGDLVISKDLGVTMNNFNIEERYKSSTITRQASKILETKKFYEEQQRLLYVALTRAIDYLFVTTAVSEKVLKEKFTSTPIRFIDWFAPIILNKSDDDYFMVEEFTSSDFDHFEKNKLEREILIGKENKELVENLNRLMSFEYPFEEYTRSPQKTSVTKIVSEMVNQVREYSGFVSSAKRGTLYHLLLEKMSLKETTEKEIKAVSENLINSRMIKREELDEISYSKLLNCLNIEDFRNLINSAEWIKKETEFYVLLGDSDNPKDKVEVQGIVDMLLSINNELYIIDYKTGFLTSESAKEKYSSQIDLYSKAICQVYGKKVKFRYILAIDMEKIFIV